MPEIQINHSRETQNTSVTKEGMEYDSRRDFKWLVVKPWIWIPRVFIIITSLLNLTIRILFEGSSNEELVQKNLALI